MINIDRLLKEKGINKMRFAEILGIKPQNVSRTLKRLHENQSEIDNILSMIGVETENKTKGGDQTGDTSNNPIVKSQQKTIETQAETINRQSKIIETLTNK